MNLTILERLLIDRKLGELPPDAAALLDAYLRLSPEDRVLAEGVEKTIDAAGTVLSRAASNRERPMPALAQPAAAMKNSGRLQHPVPAWSRRVAVAASIGLAFFLGTLTASRPDLTIVMDRPRAILPPHRDSETDGFWSVQRLQETIGPAAGAERQHIKWSAPFGKPKIGERT